MLSLQLLVGILIRLVLHLYSYRVDSARKCVCFVEGWFLKKQTLSGLLDLEEAKRGMDFSLLAIYF